MALGCQLCAATGQRAFDPRARGLSIPRPSVGGVLLQCMVICRRGGRGCFTALGSHQRRPGGTRRTNLIAPLPYSHDTQAGATRFSKDQASRRPSAEAHCGFSAAPSSGGPSNTITLVNHSGCSVDCGVHPSGTSATEARTAGTRSGQSQVTGPAAHAPPSAPSMRSPISDGHRKRASEFDR